MNYPDPVSTHMLHNHKFHFNICRMIVHRMIEARIFFNRNEFFYITDEKSTPKLIYECLCHRSHLTHLYGSFSMYFECAANVMTDCINLNLIFLLNHPVEILAVTIPNQSIDQPIVHKNRLNEICILNVKILENLHFWVKKRQIILSFVDIRNYDLSYLRFSKTFFCFRLFPLYLLNNEKWRYFVRNGRRTVGHKLKCVNFYWVCHWPILNDMYKYLNQTNPI